MVLTLCWYHLNRTLYLILRMGVAMVVFLSLITFLPVLMMIAFLILSERKILAAIQRRKGPEIVGFFGLLQSFVDGLKLVLKENIIPFKSNKLLFFFSAFFMFCCSLFTWVLLPFGIYTQIVSSNFLIFLLFILSILNAYCIILAGWSSNSKYAFLGSIRSAAQVISYEVYFGLLLVPIYLYTGSFNLFDIQLAQFDQINFIIMLPNALMFFITMLAETNRSPFDLPEAEAEIVAGYNVEYSGLIFSFFFLSEYNNMILSSFYFVTFFWGGSIFYINFEIILFIKVLFTLFLFILVRAILPRYRYDQLMSIGWTKFLPFSLALIFFHIALNSKPFNFYYQFDNFLW
jgi:NADH:ubiquinone oxidoreductase subunit H